MPEGYRIGEICEFLHKAPSELGDYYQSDLRFLDEYLSEKARKVNKAIG
jgi:hypothetical protein